MKNIDKAYVVAAVVSILFFTIGVGVGLSIFKTSSEYTTEQILDLKQRVDNAQLEYVYLSTMGDKISCSSFSELVDSSTANVGLIGGELVELDRKGERGEEFYDLKREYTILSVKAWILKSYQSQRCPDGVSALMYFYSIPCQNCISQGMILDSLRKDEFKELRVFVLDFGFDEPIIQTIKKAHNITQTPSLIIGNRTYSGLQSKEDLSMILKGEK